MPLSERARALVEFIERAADYPFMKIVESRPGAKHDVVHVEVEAQLPQHRAVPILDREPLVILFRRDDEKAPSIISARPDFPADLVHTSAEKVEPHGPVLCVWEEAWQDIKRTLTPEALVERIRDWLARTARGELHQADQPLEPLLAVGANTLVIPSGVPAARWMVEAVEQRGGPALVLLTADAEAGKQSRFGLAILQVETPTQVHGALQEGLTDLAGVADMLGRMGVDLPSALAAWLKQDDQLARADDRALIVVRIPKSREPGHAPETWEVRALMPTMSIGELGEHMGVSAMGGGGELGQKGRSVVMALGQQKALDAVPVEGWRVVQRLDQEAARHFSGTPAHGQAKIVAIGAGAIGSNLVVNCVHAGVGSWTVVDDDDTLPHNTVRQAHGNWAVGAPKAAGLAGIANAILDGDSVTPIVADYLAPGEHAAAISTAMQKADIGFDLSASPAVLGRLADEESLRRAASLFFNPDGDALVLLAEDAERRVRLDELEAQYAAAVGTQPLLEPHLASGRLDLLRYGNACQDLSRPLPPWQVQTLAGLAAGRVLALLGNPSAVAQVWKLDAATGVVGSIVLSVASVHRGDMDGWRVSISARVVEDMRLMRAAAAPNETGGVLIGSFDATRRTGHVVRALPAPPDSRQAPTYFERGAKDLRRDIDEIARRTVGMLGYLGEWHSHPPGAAARPSAEDENVWAHLSRHIGPTGRPYATIIVGEAETWTRGAWLPFGTGELVIPH